MKITGLYFIAALVIFSAGCATRSSQPAWYSGDDAKYSKTNYLLGRGQAATLEEATARARADLAQIFQVAIAVDSEDVQKYKSNGAGDGQFSVNSTRRISTSTEQIIRGIQIAETARDPAGNEYYVLAILPRLQAEESLRQQIRQLDEAVQSSIDRAKNSTDVLIRISATRQAATTQLEREGLQRALQVVDASGRGVESRYNAGKLRLDLDELLRQVRIAPKILEGSVSGLEEVVAGALSNAGFMLDTAQPVFLLKASLKLTDLGMIDGWYWQRGNLEISVSETATGRVRGAQRWPLKSSGRDKATAVRRALDEANGVLRKDLGATVTGMGNAQ